jgi:hypothetical protein
LFYQWQFNGEPISDASDSSYTITNAQYADAGTYSVAVLNPAGVTVSSNAVLTVNAPPSITRQPEGLTVTLSASVSFTVRATGSSPLAYQWRLNGAEIPGATGTALVRTNLGIGDFGSYSVLVTNAFGATLSDTAILSCGAFTASMDWHTTDGGGGISAAGPWEMAGTIAQPDPGILSAGGYVLQGGFWNRLSANLSPVAGVATYFRAQNMSLKIRIADLMTHAFDPDGETPLFAGIGSTSTNGAIVTANATYVFYNPPAANGNMTDRFTYSVKDGFQALGVGRVQVMVLGSPDTFPNVTAIATLPDGNKQLGFAGIPHHSYLVHATTNLVPPMSWVTLCTNVAGNDGLWHYIDLEATNFPSRYYRSAMP